MHPDEIYECCKCKISRTTEIDQCFVENRKKAGNFGEKCKRACNAFGFAFGERGSEGHCNSDEEQSNMCVLRQLQPHDVFQYTTSTLWGVDKFDVESWVIKHAAAVLTIPEVKAMLTSAAVNQALPIVDSCKVLNDATLNVVSPEHKALGEFSTFNYALTAAQKILLFIGGALRVGHHATAAAHISSMATGITVYSHALTLLHVPLSLFSYIVVPFKDLVLKEMMRLSAVSAILSSLQCIRFSLEKPSTFNASPKI